MIDVEIHWNYVLIGAGLVFISFLIIKWLGRPPKQFTIGGITLESYIERRIAAEKNDPFVQERYRTLLKQLRNDKKKPLWVWEVT